MPELKLIATTTTFIVDGIEIEIITQYQESGISANTIFAFLSETTGISEGVPYIEGDLVILMVTSAYPADIDFNFDVEGNLLVTAPDAVQYDFDSEGNLIYIE